MALETEYWEAKLMECYDEKYTLAIKISNLVIELKDIFEERHISHHFVLSSKELDDMLLLYKDICKRYDELITKMASGAGDLSNY